MLEQYRKQINDCMYRHAISHTPAQRNFWERRAEELEYLAYVASQAVN